jgi:hypothetical protein
LGEDVVKFEGEDYCPGCEQATLSPWEALAGPHRCPIERCQYNNKSIILSHRVHGRPDHFCPNHGVHLVPHLDPTLDLDRYRVAEGAGGGSHYSSNPELAAVDWTAV